MNLSIVTGAAGWLGRGLTHALVHGIPGCEQLCGPLANLRIRVMDLPQCIEGLPDAGKNYQIVGGDVRNPEDCRKLFTDSAGATLFHLAGVIHPRTIRDFYRVNVEGTQNILAAAQQAGVRRAIVMSSNSPLGCNPHSDHLFDEDSPYHPYMNYGRSKMQVEQAVHKVRAAGGIETVIIRAPWFYGPFQPPRQKLFFEMIRDGKAPIVGGGDNLRSMAYIDNLAQGLILASASDRAVGQTYWIADRKPYPMNEIVDTIENLLEMEFGQACAHKRMRLPGLVSDIAWCCDALIQKLGTYHQKIHVLAEMNKTIACSIDKARRDLGYDPRIELEEGMRRSLAEIYPVNNS